MDNEDFRDKERWQAIENMLVSKYSRLNKVAFKPVLHIDDCLNDPFNYNIFLELTENQNFKGLFDPLFFFNLLYKHSLIVIANSTKPITLKSYLFNLDLTKDQLLYFIDYLLKLALINHRPELGFEEDPSILICCDLIEKEWDKLNRELNPINEPNTEQKPITQINELKLYMFEYDKNWFYNPENIKNPTLLIDTINYVENERAGQFITIDFLNLMYWHYKQLFNHVDKPFDYIDNYNKLPLTEIQKHILLCMVLKWCGGVPYNRFDDRDNVFTLRKLLETEFLLQFEGQETPEKKYVIRGVNYSIYPAVFEFWDIENKVFADLPKKIEEAKPQKQEVFLNVELKDFSKNQIVLIFYYFFNYLKIFTTVDKSTIARFIHLITKEKFTKTDASDIYKRLLKSPESNKPIQTIKDLDTIKPLFQNVGLNEIVKTIENDCHKVNNGKN